MPDDPAEPQDGPSGERPTRIRRWRLLAAGSAVAVAVAVSAVLIAGITAGSVGDPSSSSAVSPTASPSSTAFGARPRSDAFTCNGRSNVVVQGRTFRDIRDDRPSITIKNCHHVVIQNNDFVNDAEPIYVVDSSDVTISGNRYRNITGPHQRNGSHRGNFTQWQDSTGGSIVGNTGLGGDTEDIVSIYRSGGTDAGHPLLIEGNVFEGDGWVSSSGSGILVGDGGGAHILVRGNTLINPGQVGIGVAGGEDIRVVGNTVIGKAAPSANVGMYVWNQSTTACKNIEVGANTIDFHRADGSRSSLYDGGGCGSVAGWGTNAIDGTVATPVPGPSF